ncbi:MAG: acyl-CoA desaturase [Acidocella sp.]|nr:acyl-CoA desaturase [Acidocella sp.]
MSDTLGTAVSGPEMPAKRRLWRSFAASNAKIFPYFQVLGLACVVAALFINQNWSWWALSGLVYFLMSCLGLTVTYHRFLTHRAFRMKKWKEYLFCSLGAFGCTGSPIGWVMVHRLHHLNADKPGDPHSPSLRNFEILAGRLDVSFNKWTMRRMLKEPFHRILHEYYFLWLLAAALLLLAISPMVLLFGLLVPAGILLNVSSLSNYLNHKIGYRNFDTDDDSTNNAFIALLAWGEGWHNNHHRNPRAWNLQTRWWELDPTAWVIRCVRDD